MFSGYFRGAKYYEWNDVEEPIVRISNDASMGWMITLTRVRRVRKKRPTERSRRRSSFTQES